MFYLMKTWISEVFISKLSFDILSIMLVNCVEVSFAKNSSNE